MRKFCIAPMMERTDRHERYFLRCISKRSYLYTEMIHCNAILFGQKEPLLKYSSSEHPLAIQLGGSDPGKLSECSVIAEEIGYKEVNLNIGCPSQRVQNGSFGAILMKEPKIVAKCIKSMMKSVNIPITIKCRIGVDDMCEKEDLKRFIQINHDQGVNTFIVHARKAWLKGLNPKQNREVPPLNYERVYRLKEEFPEAEIIINGGIKSIEESKFHLNYIDGVMMGREAYDNPYILKDVDHEIFGELLKEPSREDILTRILPYIEMEVKEGISIQNITRHLMGLYKGTSIAKRNRKFFANLINDSNPIPSIRKLIETEIKAL